MQIYAGRAKTPPVAGKKMMWHLSYLPSGHPNRMSLCGKRGLVAEERIIFGPRDLEKFRDESNTVCKICEGSTPIVVRRQGGS